MTNVETSKDQVKVFAALKQGNEAQKLLQKAVALEDVEKLMEDTAEARKYQDQLQRVLGESWTGEDEGAIEAELEALASEMLKEELPAVPAGKVKTAEEVLPSVPTHTPTSIPTASPLPPPRTKQENELQPMLA